MARRRRSRPRHRFEHSVPVVLGERTAARPLVVRPAWVLGGLGAVAFVGLVLWAAFSPRFYVSEARVVGVSRVSEQAVFAASGLPQLHILWVDADAAERQIQEQLPPVKAADVSCHLPAECTITVVEHQLALTWETDRGLLWVDEAGGSFPASGPLEGRWLVSGPLPVDDQGLVEQEVLVALDELARLGIQPGRISYRTGRGLIVQDPAGWPVILGQGEGMEQRLRVYAAVRAHLLAQGIQPRFVDVRFPEAPYYSETNEW
jgi:cell division septal protein FtsQ